MGNADGGYMRIIGGKYSGKKLISPTTGDTRPTSDKARQAIYNVLSHSDFPPIYDAVVLDIFAGSGAMGLEALSRGAKHAYFIDNHSAAIKVISQNVVAIGEQEKSTILKRDATQLFTAIEKVDYVFCDPPYEKGFMVPALNSLKEKGWLKDKAICVIEMHKSEQSKIPEFLHIIKEKTYGLAKILFATFNTNADKF